jgi:hypothetical protein
LLAEWLEGLGGEDGLDGEAEKCGDLESEFEAGTVVPALKEADGLVVDADGIGQVLAADAPLGTQDSDAIVKTTITGRVLIGGIHFQNQLLRIQKIIHLTKV